MFKLPKKVEYALLSLQYMAVNKDKLITAKELSDELKISFEFLAKTLQALMKKKLVASQQGIKGGYYLIKDPAEITINIVLDALEQRSNIVDCTSNPKTEVCNKAGSCTLRSPMATIQRKIDEILDFVTVETLCENTSSEKKTGSMTISKDELISEI
jgi:Rrf2 family protein